MARLRQQYPQNYRASGNISAEFESVIRYLNAAELGNKTVGELLAVLFDDDGAFKGPIELRRNLDGNLEYRVGSYISADEGWQILVSAADLRGAPGIDAGEIGSPLLHSRLDVAATAGQTTVAYAHTTQDAIQAYKNGILLREGASYDYTTNPVTGLVTFTPALAAGNRITLYKVRKSAISGYRREDIDTLSNQVVFPFLHEDGDELNIYLNGILQRPGGAYDYIANASTDTITFTSTIPAGNRVTIITAQTTSAQTVTGLMTESTYTDLATGLIKLAKIAVPDNAFAMAKIAGLAAALTGIAKMTAQATPPTGAATGALWLDTSTPLATLRVYDGTKWLLASPDSVLPGFSTANAGQLLHVNGTGTSLEFKAVDLSATLKKVDRGAANGVAALDANGRMPSAQLPEVLGSDTFWYEEAAATANGTKTFKRVYQQKVRIVGLSVGLTSGTCSVQFAVNGVATGPVFSVSSTTSNQTLAAPIEVNATTAPVSVDLIVSAQASAQGLKAAASVRVLAV